jgi:branched-subunit amino acid ABC-type transport system permease component
VGPSARNLQEPITGRFDLFYLQYPWYRVATALLAGAIIGALWLFLKRGTYGIWIRATTQDRIMAAAMGIPVPAVHTAVFAIGAAMAAASGVLFGPLGGVTQTMGADFTLRAFIVSWWAGWATWAARSWRRSSSACWRRTPRSS